MAKGNGSFLKYTMKQAYLLQYLMAKRNGSVEIISEMTMAKRNGSVEINVGL